MLVAEGIQFRYDSPLFEGLSFACAEGEVLGVTGPSGVGKTTLLGLLGDGLQPQGGTIRLKGLSPAEAIKKQAVGLVPQVNTLLPNRKVRDNVALPLLLRRGRYTWISLPTEEKEQVVWAMRTAQIADASELYPSQLSGGMAARAMLARAIVIEPAVLLLDEAFAALDEVTCEGIYLSLQKIFIGNRMSGLVVSHRIAEVVRLSSRVLVLRRNNGNDPARIVHEEKVSLDWPRTASVLHDPVFLRACANVRSHLGIEGGL